MYLVSAPVTRPAGPGPLTLAWPGPACARLCDGIWHSITCTCALQATSVGDLLYVSGQIPLLPGTTKFAAADIEGQTDQVLKNLGAILEKAGSSFDQVLKTTVLLYDMADFQKMNGVYGGCLPNTGAHQA